jgi:hypothetical protein
METRKSHIVPAFYLRHFADSRGQLWCLDKKTRKIYASSPTKAATGRDFYRGETAVHEDDLEKRLAAIESAAAPHLRSLIDGKVNISPEVARFLAWMMARTGWLRELPGHYEIKEYLNENFEELSNADDGDKGRPLPFVFRNSSDDVVSVSFRHSRKYLESSDWKLEMTQDQFLDVVRLQAYLFQTIHFSRLKWVTVRPPDGQRFITSDRPATWDVMSFGWNSFPAVLKHPDVDLIFPVSPYVSLMGGHDQASMLGLSITPSEINSRISYRANRFLYAQEKADLEIFSTLN